jgi:signal transduction histidine kinase/PAS domain-containing protein
MDRKLGSKTFETPDVLVKSQIAGFSDADAAKLLTLLSLLLFTAGAITSVMWFWRYGAIVPSNILALGSPLLILFAVWRRNLWAAGIVFVYSLILAGLLGALFGAGLPAPATIGLTVAVMTAGWLFGARTALIAAGVATLGLISIFSLHLAGREFLAPPLTNYLIVNVIAIAVGSAVGIAAKNGVLRQYERATAYANELANKNIELASATERLSELVAERTSQLAATERSLTAALESMDAAITIYSADGTLFEWNDKYVDFFPATAQAVRFGAQVSEIYSILQSQGNVSADLPASSALCPGVYAGIASDGRRLRTTVREIEGGGHVTITVDLTELYQALQSAELSVALMQEAMKIVKLSYAVYSPDEKLVDFSAGFNHAGPLSDSSVRVGVNFSTVMGLVEKFDMREIPERSTVVDGQTWSGTLPLALRVGVWDRHFRNGRFSRTHVTRRENDGYIVVTVDLTDIRKAQQQAEINARIAEAAITSVGASYSAWDGEERLLQWNTSLRPDGKTDPAFFGAEKGMPWAQFVENIRTKTSQNRDGESRLPDGRRWVDDIPLAERIGIWEREKQDGTFYRSTVTRLPGDLYLVVTLDLTNIHRARREAEINAEMTAAAIKSIGASFSAWSPDEKLIRWESALPNDFMADSPFVGATPGLSWTEFTTRMRKNPRPNKPGETAIQGSVWSDPLPLTKRIGNWDREKADGTVMRSIVSKTKDGVFIVVTQDFTDIHEARKQAERNEEIVRAAVSSLGAVFGVYDDQGRLLEVSDKIATGSTALQTPKVDPETSFADLQAIIRRGRGGDEIAEKSTLRDGRPFSRQTDIMSAVGVWDRRFPDGGYVRTTVKQLATGEYLLVSIDLTEIDEARKNAERAKQEAIYAEEMLREIMASTVKSMGVYDRNERRKLFGHNTLPNLAPDASYRDVIDRRILDGVREIPERSTKKNGKLYLEYTPLEQRVGTWDRYLTDGRFWRTRVIRLSNGDFAVYTQDLSDLNNAREALAKNEKMAALGSLVAGVAHEVNTPLGVAVTAASLHAEGLASVFDAFKNKQLTAKKFEDFLTQSNEVIDLVMRNLQRSATLISTFKQVSVDQTSDMRRRFLLRQYIGEVVDSLSPTIRGRNIRIEIEGDEVEIDGYPGAIAQVATNLVMNALSHAFPDQEAKGTIRISVAKLGDESVRITYRDNGVGMNDEVLRKVFDPFITTKRGQGGTGLGMTIVHNLVLDRLGGTIDIRSQANDGVKIEIVVPVVSPGPN